MRRLQQTRLAGMGRDPGAGASSVASVREWCPGAHLVDAEKGERLDLTIDSGCAACGLPVSVASEVSMPELSRPPQEYVRANAEKIRELGLKTPTLRFQNGDMQSLRFSVMDELHKPLVAASKIVAAGNRIVMQSASRGSFVEVLGTKRRERIFKRSGACVVPCWVFRQTSQKRLAPLDELCPKDRQGYPITSAETRSGVRMDSPSESTEMGTSGPSAEASESHDMEDVVQEAD